MTPVSVFLSYARSDDEPFVKRLHADLTKAGFTVWFDRESLLSRGLTYHQEIKDAIRTGVNRVVYVGGPKAAMSQHVREEWQFALECDHVVVTPILRLGDYEHVPGELSLLHCEDFRDDAKYDAALAKLITSLREPNPKLGALFALPNLPPNFLGRPELMRRVRDALLVDLQKPQVITSADARVGMQGMGGIGKSVLAAALGRNRQVRQAYPDGVIWIACGQKLSDDDLVKRQRDLARHLGGDENFTSLAQGQGVLRPLLATKAVLLVLDDVWRAVDAQAFDVVGPRCRMLVTTRDKGILDALHGELVPVSLFTEPEALQLLADAVNMTPDALLAEARAVARECGFLPLALALCGGMARKQGGGFHSVLERLRRAALEKIADRESINEQHRSIWRAMQASVEMLPAEEQERFAELSVFATDQTVPEAAAATLWSHTGELNDLDSEDLLINLSERSLIQLEQKTDAEGKVRRRFSLHDLLHDYAVRVAGEPQAVHQKLVDAYRNKCSDGWHTGPNDGYFFQHLPVHLSRAGMTDELGNLLTDFRWIRAKLDATDVHAVVSDYDIIAGERSQKLLQGALRLSAHVLSVDNAQLASQLTGRLLSFTDESLQRLVGDACKYTSGPWLRPLKASLTSPGGPLVRTLGGHMNGVNAVALTPDGRHVVSGSTDMTLKVWDLSSGQCTATLQGHSDWVSAVALTPDGQHAVSGSADMTLKVWDLSSGQCTATLQGHTGVVYAVALTPDGRHAVSGSNDRTLKVWDLSSGQCTATLQGHSDRVSAVALTPDGQHAVSGSDDRTLKVWDLSSGQCTATLQGRTGVVYAVALTPDGRHAVSGSYDKTLKVWDLSSGQCTSTLEGHTGDVRAVALMPDGRHAVSGSNDRTLKVWDLSSGQCTATLQGHTGPVYAVALTPDGQYAVSGSTDMTLKVWDLSSRQCAATLQGHADWVLAVALTPDGRHAVSGSYDKTLKVWNLSSGQCTSTLEGHTGDVRAVALTPDSRYAVSGSGDATIKVWDLSSGQCTSTLKGHTGPVYAVALTPDGRHAVSGSNLLDKTLKVWDLSSGQCTATLQGHTGPVPAVALTPDGRYAVSGSADTTLKVWNLSSGQCTATLQGHTDWVSAVALTPDGRYAVSGSADTTLKVWDLSSGQCTATLEGHADRVHAVALTPDGQRAVSGSTDGTLKVWNLSSGVCTATLQGHGDRVLAWAFIVSPHNTLPMGSVLAVALTPDGRHAVSGSSEKTLKVWDLSSGRRLAWFAVDSRILRCALAPDGRTVVAGEESGRMHFLRLEGIA